MDFLNSIKVLPKNTRIFVVRAGNNARYREIFETESKVFLEIPGVAPIVDFVENGDSEHIRKLLQRSMDIIQKKEPKSLEDYDGNKALVAPLLGSFVSLYAKAHKGDLILVPNIGYQAPFLIGEIISDFSDDDTLFSNKYQGNKIPYRKVRWLSKDINKKKATTKLSDKLKNRKAVIEITETDIKKEIFGYAYKKYVYNDTSKACLSGAKYNGKNLQGIIDTLQAVQILTEKLGIQDDVDVKINFNSPGNINIFGNGSKAIIVAAIVSSCLSGVAYAETKQDLQESKIVQECQDSPILDSLDEKTYQEVCDKTQKAEKEIQLEVP